MGYAPQQKAINPRLLLDFEHKREVTVTGNKLSEANQGELLERAIVHALLEITDDLRLDVGLEEIWPMIYARVPCTEAEFWSTMDNVIRILKCKVANRRAQKRAHLSIVN